MPLLGYIRKTMLTRRIASRFSFSSKDLDKALELEMGNVAQAGTEDFVKEHKKFYEKAHFMMKSPRLKTFKFEGEPQARRSP